VNYELSIPGSASFYILLQRTAYQSPLLRRVLRRIPGRVSLFCARIEAAARRRSIAARFERGIQRDFRSILPSLLETAGAILDVGCGLGAIDVLLSRHYSEAAAPSLYLADFGDTATRIDYRFGPSHAHYNSFEVARGLLLKNGVPAESLHFISPKDIARPEYGSRFDLVISTLAWGFHFPVETYAEAVSAAMADGARLILDVRVGTNGIDQLRKWFSSVDMIEESEVRRRVVAAK
jgi:SAM-dependent methyltransferase